MPTPVVPGRTVEKEGQGAVVTWEFSGWQEPRFAERGSKEAATFE